MTDQLTEAPPDPPAAANPIAAQRAAGWADLHYDHRGSKMVVAPYDLWRRLRAQCPVLHSDRYDGLWFVSRYDDVRRVLTEYETFTTTEGSNIPKQNMLMLPLEVDPPLHRQYRSLINPLLSPQTVAECEPWIRALARERIRKLAGREQFDANHDFCEPFAKRVALRVIGFEPEDLEQLDHWTSVLSVGVRNDEEGIRISTEFFTHLGATLAKRAGEPPRDDLISALVDGEIDGRPLSAEEQQSMLLILTFGGLHTTGAVIAGSLVWLAGHPEDRVRLRSEPALLDTAVDEFVRYVTPVSHMRRTTTTDTVISGCPVGAGEQIMFGMGSANHDETVFERPDDVILDRFPNHHVAFGGGPHRCVGSHLAKLGVRIALEEFLATFDNFEVTDYQALTYHGGESRSLDNVPFIVRSPATQAASDHSLAGVRSLASEHGSGLAG